MCNCSGRETSACISEYVCPSCGTRWRRNAEGQWVKRCNPYTTAPEPSKTKSYHYFNEEADREAARYENDIVRSWDAH